MCSDLNTASQGCAIFSATGILFMSFIGIMLMKQPFFILGIEDVERAKGNAFGAAATFLFTFLLSIFYLLKEGRRLNISLVQEEPGRGRVHRFGEYSTVGVQQEHTSAEDHSEEDEGTFTFT